MKKTYIAPDMTMVKIDTVSMIAASNPKVFTDPVDAGDAGAPFFDDLDEDLFK